MGVFEGRVAHETFLTAGPRAVWLKLHFFAFQFIQVSMICTRKRTHTYTPKERDLEISKLG